MNNFQETLTSPCSDLANQTLKDSYNFDFLILRKKHDEKELEGGLINHIQKFLLELGAGFAFVGKQMLIKAGNQDFYVDLLFYHYKLRCFVVVELKTNDFSPKDVGQMSFYLTAIDKIYNF